MDFFGSFLVITLLVVLIVLGSIIYFFILIFRKIFNKIKAEKNEKKILAIADTIYFYQENKNTKDPEEILKNINIPKKMRITKENNEIFIEYKNLTYSLDKGRFILQA